MLAALIDSLVRFFPGKIRLNTDRLLGAREPPAPGESSQSRLTGLNIFITIQKKPPGSNRSQVTGRENSLSPYVAAICRRSYASAIGIKAMVSFFSIIFAIPLFSDKRHIYAGPYG
jgi:hypothetical protein